MDQTVQSDSRIYKSGRLDNVKLKKMMDDNRDIRQKQQEEIMIKMYLFMLVCIY